MYKNSLKHIINIIIDFGREINDYDYDSVTLQKLFLVYLSGSAFSGRSIQVVDNTNYWDSIKDDRLIEVTSQ